MSLQISGGHLAKPLQLGHEESGVIGEWVTCIKETQTENAKSERQPSPDPTPEPSPRKLKLDPELAQRQSSTGTAAPKKEERDVLLTVETKKSPSPLSPRSTKAKKGGDGIDTSPKETEKPRSDLGRSKSSSSKKKTQYVPKIVSYIWRSRVSVFFSFNIF